MENNQVPVQEAEKLDSALSPRGCDLWWDFQLKKPYL